MENPLSGGELFVSILTGALGFGTMDMVDRFLATHALTAGTAANSFTDTPPTTGGAGGYQGLYNATAVLAPLNWQRWTAGLLGPAVPLIAAQMIKAPVGRSALQMFGFGALMSTAGKGLTQLIAMFGNQTAFAQRLYDPEIRAAIAQVTNSGGTSTWPTPPTSGLGRAPAVHQLGMGSSKCSGGSRCRCNTCACNQQQPVQPQPTWWVPPTAGTWTPPSTNGNPPPPVTGGTNTTPPIYNPLPPSPVTSVNPPPPVTTTAPGTFNPTLPIRGEGKTLPQQPPRVLAGVPNGRRKNKYQWGHKDSDQDIG